MKRKIIVLYLALLALFITLYVLYSTFVTGSRAQYTIVDLPKDSGVNCLAVGPVCEQIPIVLKDRLGREKNMGMYDTLVTDRNNKLYTLTDDDIGKKVQIKLDSREDEFPGLISKIKVL